MNVDDCIFFLIAKAKQAGAAFWGQKVAHLNVTAAQAVVLNFLRDEDDVTSHALGQRLQITSATMTGILDRLEKMELIERKPNPEDRRAILVCLTQRGLDLADKINDIVADANNEFLHGLTRDEKTFLRDILKRIVEQ